MLEPRFDLAWKEDLSDDSRALMARRFMEVTETLGVLMMAGQPDWRHTDVGVVVVVTPNICKYLLTIFMKTAVSFTTYCQSQVTFEQKQTIEQNKSFLQ